MYFIKRACIILICIRVSCTHAHNALALPSACCHCLLELQEEDRSLHVFSAAVKSGCFKDSDKMPPT